MSGYFSTAGMNSAKKPCKYDFEIYSFFVMFCFLPVKISLLECSWKVTRERLGISPKQIHLRIQTNTSGHNFAFVTQL